jgi:hypothetical protein
MENVTNMTFIVYAIDSRGNSTPVTKSFESWKDYSAPVIKAGSVERANGVGTETTLKFEGTIWNNTFGKEDNKITKCKYRYKKSNESEYGNLIDITPTREEDLFSFNSTIKGDLEANGFNASNSFNIQVIVEDEIRTATYEVLLGSGTPAMAIHPDGVAFGAPYDKNEGGSCQVDGKSLLNLIYPIGSIYMSVNSTNPSLLFGGTWVAWGAGRVPVGIDTSQTEFATIEKTGGEKIHTLTESELPSHQHSIGFDQSANGGTEWLKSGGNSGGPFWSNQYCDSTGGNQPHNNLQPYITCYMWKRTA